MSSPELASAASSEYISVPCAPAEISTSRRASADSDVERDKQADQPDQQKQTEAESETQCESLTGSAGESCDNSLAEEEARMERERQVAEPTLDYATQLKKYSWRMEVHGDPLKIKFV